MAQMRIAALAGHLDAVHAAGIIHALGHALRLAGVVEGGPATAGMEFLVRGEQLRATAHAVIGAIALGIELLIGLAKRALRSGGANHTILFRRQQLAPFFVGLDDFVGLGVHGRLFLGSWGFVFRVSNQGHGGKEREGTKKFHDRNTIQYKGERRAQKAYSFTLAIHYFPRRS